MSACIVMTPVEVYESLNIVEVSELHHYNDMCAGVRATIG